MDHRAELPGVEGILRKMSCALSPSRCPRPHWEGCESGVLAQPSHCEGWGLRIEHWLLGQAPRGALSLRCSGNPAMRLPGKGLVMEAER